MKYWGAIALCLMLAACGHRGDLKTPTQAKVAKAKADAKAAKRAEANPAPVEPATQSTQIVKEPVSPDKPVETPQ